MNHGSLFSGIGGFDLAAEWMGWNNIFNCEWEEFPRKVLKHHFPNAEQHEDIREFDATTYAGRIDILSGGFPCQPFSVAGKRLGKEDERHLWPEMLRIIRECSPRWVVGENVRGLVSWSGGLVLEEVYSDLEALGYSVQSFIIPACATGAPHRRDRVWIVAHANDKGRSNGHGEIQGTDGEVQQRNDCPEFSDTNLRNAPDTENSGCRGGSGEERKERRERMVSGEREGRTMGSKTKGCSRIGFQNFPTEPPVCGGDDGLPKELDGITFSKWRKESIKAYGNAIVPQVALQIFQAIQQYENMNT